jgi:hypothetical protein
MITAVADTHSVIWYLANDSRLGVPVISIDCKNHLVKKTYADSMYGA